MDTYHYLPFWNETQEMPWGPQKCLEIHSDSFWPIYNFSNFWPVAQDQIISPLLLHLQSVFVQACIHKGYDTAFGFILGEQPKHSYPLNSWNAVWCMESWLFKTFCSNWCLSWPVYTVYPSYDYMPYAVPTQGLVLSVYPFRQFYKILNCLIFHNLILTTLMDWSW